MPKVWDRFEWDDENMVSSLRRRMFFPRLWFL
jgi:hypothetical protein